MINLIMLANLFKSNLLWDRANFILIALVVMILSSCQYNDTELWNSVNELNNNNSIPTDIVVLKKKVYLTSEGTCSFDVIVNPSDAIVNLEAENGNASFVLNLANKSRASYVEEPTSYKICKVEKATDEEGEVLAGKFKITLVDLNESQNYLEEITVVLRIKNAKNEVIEISSDLITVEWGEGTSLESFKIGNYKTSINDNFIDIRIPYGTDLTQLKPMFDVPEYSKVYVGDEQQISGVTAQDFSMPVEYKVVSDEGLENTYLVSASFSDLPMMYINTNNIGVNSKEEYTEDLTVYVCNMGESNKMYSKVKMKGRGNSSWDMPKKSYTMKLDKKDEFMGLKKHKTFALVANYADKTLLRNDFAYKIGRKLYDNMPWNPSSVSMHLVVDGKYYGLYSATETNKIDANRINIPNIEDCIDVSAAANYGFLMEINTGRMDEVFNFTTTQNVGFSLKDPDGADISEDLQKYIQATIQGVEDALYASGFLDKTSKNYYKNYIDVPSFIDWYLVNEITKNNDAIFWTSCYMYYDPSDRKMHMGPIWDFDISCGNINYNNCDLTTGFWIKNAKWISRMFEDPEFVADVKARFNEKKTALLYMVNNEFKQQTSDLTFDAKINFARWPILGIYVWPNAAGYAKRTTYQLEVDYMVDWLNARIAWLDTAINNL